MEKLQLEIVSDISKLTRLIEDKYPELQKYLDESRITLPQGNFNSGELNIETLKEYRDSLKDLINTYAK